VLLEHLTEIGEHDLDFSAASLNVSVTVVGRLFRMIIVYGTHLGIFSGTAVGRCGEVHVEFGRRGPRRVRVENAAKRLDEVTPPCPGLPNDQGVLPRLQLQLPPASKRRDTQLPNTHSRRLVGHATGPDMQALV
jgi:hypothetical protein